jgi:hypothetical protein
MLGVAGSVRILTARIFPALAGALPPIMRPRAETIVWIIMIISSNPTVY